MIEWKKICCATSRIRPGSRWSKPPSALALAEKMSGAGWLEIFCAQAALAHAVHY